ncbi:methyltransferase domain-containing protein, partial [Streptomyces sp. ISL-100]|nr:methyltransferase domain-containing protein [Streptomyces sp. ISL-100]
MVSGFNDALFAAAAIGEHDRVLDIGCGSGQTTRLAARLAAHGSVVGVDISRPLIERARASTDSERIVYELGDAQSHPFPPAAYDVAISRGGVMFFADHAAAFTHIGGALRPGGRLVFICPQPPEPDGEEARTLGLLGSLTGQPEHSQVELRRAMGSLSEPARVHEVLGEAGFGKVTVTPVVGSTVWGRDAADAVDFLVSRAGTGDSVPASTRAAMEDVLRPYETGRGVVMRAGVWVGSRRYARRGACGSFPQPRPFPAVTFCGSAAWGLRPRPRSSNAGGAERVRQHIQPVRRLRTRPKGVPGVWGLPQFREGAGRGKRRRPPAPWSAPPRRLMK